VNAPVELPNLTQPGRRPADALFERLEKESASFDLFQAMRLIECAFPDKPRLGDAMRPVDEPFRFAQEASLIFAPAPVAAFEPSSESARPRLVQRVFGFLGPNGALPIHLTEYARERALYNSDRTFGRFLDMLLHRFGLFFYRAWARTQPVVALDRPDDAPIVRHIGALLGLIEPSTRNQDALGDFPKLFFAGRLARSVRDADGLEAWLSLHFGVPVRVDQFQGHWMPLGREERTRLKRDGQPAVGRGAVLGRSVWDVQHKFRIVMGPLSWDRFATLLPEGKALESLRALVRQFVGFEFVWDLRLILKGEDVPLWTLARSRDRRIGRLGQTSWLKDSRNARRLTDADDLIMNVESIRLGSGRKVATAA
jgi:type VI secretion system protein ImpH